MAEADKVLRGDHSDHHVVGADRRASQVFHQAVDQDEGPYGAEGFVRQAVATLPRFEENYAAIGSWIAGRWCVFSASITRARSTRA